MSFTGKGGIPRYGVEQRVSGFILEQLFGLERIAYRAMMGEFILYYRGKIVGGIYDDRFLVKPTKSALERIPRCRKPIRAQL